MRRHPRCYRRRSSVTSFNRRLYERLLERHRNGLLIELAFLASDFSEEEMGSITRMVREARERVSSREEVVRCADVIRKEHQLLALEQPERLSPRRISGNCWRLCVIRSPEIPQAERNEE